MPMLRKLMCLATAAVLIFALMVGCTSEQSQLNEKTEIAEKPRLEKKNGISSLPNTPEQSYKNFARSPRPFRAGLNAKIETENQI